MTTTPRPASFIDLPAISGQATPLTFGAVGNGIADDTAAIASINIPVYTPPNAVYKTATGLVNFDIMALGYGQIIASGGNKQAPNFVGQIRAPSSFGDTTYVGNAFTGDLSRLPFAAGKIISGTNTLGSPTNVYQTYPENALLYHYLTNVSGVGGGSSNGRSGVATHWVVSQNLGQGDAIAYYAISSVTGSYPGATSFLDSPAGGLFSGQCSGHTNGVYLNPVEIHNIDNGNDVGSINFVATQSRTNDTGGLGAVWYGYRSQSGGSTTPIDAHFSAQGPSKIAIDLTSFTSNASGTWTNAAITMLGGDRIYFNATAGSSPGYATTPGTSYLYYSTSNGIQAVVNNSAAFLFTTSSAFIYAATVTLAQNSNNKLQVLGAASGSAPSIAVTASSDTNQDLKISALGTGQLKFGNAGSFSANGAIATALSSIGPTGSHTTVQEWLTIKNASGVVRYIPCF